jgi:hypothetical protein
VDLGPLGKKMALVERSTQPGVEDLVWRASYLKPAKSTGFGTVGILLCIVASLLLTVCHAFQRTLPSATVHNQCNVASFLMSCTRIHHSVVNQAEHPPQYVVDQAEGVEDAGRFARDRADGLTWGEQHSRVVGDLVTTAGDQAGNIKHVKVGLQEIVGHQASKPMRKPSSLVHGPEWVN